MANTFDRGLPKTTSYWTEDAIFFIKNTSFFISEEEGHAMAELLIFAMNDPATKGIVVNNREAGGAWPQEVSAIWQNDERYTSGLGKKKIATLTDSMIKTMQLNRLSREVGMQATSKGFNSEFNDEVKAFLLG